MTSDREQADVAAVLRDRAADAADRVAIRWQGRTISYGDLDGRVDAAAGALAGLGVVPGDRVALVLGNTPTFVESYLGALRAGAAVVPLNPGLTAEELRFALEDSGAVVCVSMAGAADAVRQAAPAATTVVVAGAGPGEWSELLGAAPAAPAVERAPEDIAAIVYTSGTTGRPRGAMLTRANLTANQQQSLAGRFQIGPEDRVLIVLPLFHIYALNVALGASLRVGAEMRLLERFDPVTSLATIAADGISIVLGAPPMYIAWLATPTVSAAHFESVRLAVSGAAALPAEVFRRFRDELGVEINEGYGLTEASPSVTSNAMADEPRAGSVGLPLPEVTLRLVDDADREVEQGDPGEVWVRGPNVFVGYWNDPEATAEVLTEDGWLRTGDVGTRDRDGFLYLVDRRSDLIIVSGFNVYPREVERVLYKHEAVAEAAVVGVPHPYSGEAVKAFVVLRPGVELSGEDLQAFCGTRLARYKCPEAIELVDELPYTATGKVRRVELRGG